MQKLRPCRRRVRCRRSAEGGDVSERLPLRARKWSVALRPSDGNVCPSAAIPAWLGQRRGSGGKSPLVGVSEPVLLSHSRCPPSIRVSGMKRRDLMLLLGGAAITWPRPAPAQQKAMLVIGYLHPGAPDGPALSTLAAFHQGLGVAGYIEGQNV